MDQHIKATNFTKSFKIYQKEAGLMGSIKGLFSRKYKTIDAVKDVNFEISRGELVGFIGPNGAGKTTTLKMLSGLLFPTEGVAEVLGYTPFDRKAEFLKQISLVMGQKNQLWWDLPAIETINLNKEIYDVPAKKYKRILGEFVSLLGVEEILNQQVRKLSLGQRMKCELIASLIHTPKVLFLDEPTIGLDVVMQKRVREFIKEYNRRYKATVILTSHYMDDVKEVCERVIMIAKGKIVFDGKIDKLINKYSNYKQLIANFNQKVAKDELKKYGKIKKFDETRVVLNVSRKEVSHVASSLLSKYDIDDLDINEPRLEEIIRMLFERS